MPSIKLDNVIDFFANLPTSDRDTITRIISGFELGKLLAYKDLVQIGKPIKLNKMADPKQRYYWYMMSKLHAIDLYPVDFVTSFTELFNALKNDQSLASLLNHIRYDYAISEYKELCDTYGLEPAMGIRIWATEDTVVADTISNQYQPNVLRKAVDVAYSYGRQVMQVARAVGAEDWLRSVMGTVLDNIVGILRKTAETVDTGMDTLHAELSALGLPEIKLENATSSIETALRALGAIAADAARITFPQIWMNSEYTPSLTLLIRLHSPYGSPTAIKEFILKPLLYLLLLIAPRSDDGFTYYDPPFIRVVAHGLADIVLCAVSSVTLKRGGNDVSYNIFKQPLTVDVTVTLLPLITAFAAVTHDEDYTIDDVSKAADVDHRTYMTTVGKLLRSLAPTFVVDPATVKEQALPPIGPAELEEDENTRITQYLTGEVTRKEVQIALEHDLGAVPERTVETTSVSVSAAPSRTRYAEEMLQQETCEMFFSGETQTYYTSSGGTTQVVTNGMVNICGIQYPAAYTHTDAVIGNKHMQVWQYTDDSGHTWLAIVDVGEGTVYAIIDTDQPEKLLVMRPDGTSKQIGYIRANHIYDMDGHETGYLVHQEPVEYRVSERPPHSRPQPQPPWYFSCVCG